MNRLAVLAFSALAYLVFLATFLYLVAFVSGLGIVPRDVDHPAAGFGPPLALAIDLLLVVVFAMQHSVMARPAFKRWWTGFVPAAVERSVYVLAASLALILLFVCWQPVPSPIWTASGPAAAMLWAICAAGWMLVLLSTFLISHFELFGLKQAWNNWCGRMQEMAVFRTPLFYRFVRHPLYLGFLLAFWSTPAMTVGHLLFASAMSTFMLIAIQFEERDLTDAFGDAYRRYRERTGMLVPRLGRAPRGMAVRPE